MARPLSLLAMATAMICSVTIIGRSKGDYVWLMSRTPEMRDADYARYRDLITSWGYDPSKLIRMPQHWP